MIQILKCEFINYELIVTIFNYIKEFFTPTFFNYAKETIEFITTTLVSLIAIYTFYRTFISKKIKFLAYCHGSSVWDGDNISVSIQNFTLSTMAIKKVSMIVDDKYSILVKEYNEPLILEPLKSINIISNNFTKNELLSSSNFLDMSKKLFIEVGENTIVAKIKKHRKKKYNISAYQPSTNISCYSNGRLITENMKYIVYLLKNKIIAKEIIILKNGSMNCTIDGGNAIPSEALQNTETLKLFFENLINDNEITIVAQNYSVESLCKEE